MMLVKFHLVVPKTVANTSTHFKLLVLQCETRGILWRNEISMGGACCNPNHVESVVDDAFRVVVEVISHQLHCGTTATRPTDIVPQHIW